MPCLDESAEISDRFCEPTGSKSPNVCALSITTFRTFIRPRFITRMGEAEMGPVLWYLYVHVIIQVVCITLDVVLLCCSDAGPIHGIFSKVTVRIKHRSTPPQ